MMSAAYVARTFHKMLVQRGVEDCPPRPPVALGEKLLRVFAKYASNVEVEDLCQELALKVLSKDFSSMSWSSASAYLRWVAVHVSISVAHHQAVQAKTCVEAPLATASVQDAELFLFEIQAFAASLKNIHPQAPKYIEASLEGFSDKELIDGKFFSGVSVSSNYWTRFKGAIRERLAEYSLQE